MAEGTCLADPHVTNAGIAACDGGAVIWLLLIGHARAKQFIFAGERVGAQKAAEIGLVNMTVADSDLENHASDWALRLANGISVALQFTKQMVNRQLNEAIQRTLDVSLAIEGLSFQSWDHKGALSAIPEKRKPTFRGA